LFASSDEDGEVEGADETDEEVERHEEFEIVLNSLLELAWAFSVTLFFKPLGKAACLFDTATC
jgi:hypothetical protein